MSAAGQHVATPLVLLSQFDFHPRLAEISGTALVAFTSADCGGCRQLRRVLQEVARREPAWRLYEVDAQRDAALTNEFEVFHLPTIFLFNGGAFHCELRAEARPSAIIAATLAALRRAPQEAP
jgi:thioredoxin-like negative regulator of GroEL